MAGHNKKISEKEKIGNRKGMEEEAIKRSAEALRLKIAGASYRQIGEQLGVSHTRAKDDVKRALRETLDSVKEEADEYRELELERLDILWSRWFPLAVNKETPDSNAAYRCLQIAKARRELLGIDAPQKHAIKDSEGNDIDFTGIAEARQEAKGRLDRLLAGAEDKGNTNGNGKR